MLRRNVIYRECRDYVFITYIRDGDDDDAAAESAWGSVMVGRNDERRSDSVWQADRWRGVLR